MENNTKNNNDPAGNSGAIKNIMRICGIDEAGRGPAIGPLVICGVMIEESQEKHQEKRWEKEKSQEGVLAALGVKDSKLLTPKKREFLFPKIKEIVKAYHLISIPPDEIDLREMAGLNLNQLEALKSAQIINALKPDKAILDCPSNNIREYVRTVQSYLAPELKNIILCAEHKADEKYVVVAAASILAKVTRDMEIEALKKEIGIDFGSGYPSDPLTQEFLEKYHDKLDKIPYVIRQSWDSFKQARAKKSQKTLFSFSEDSAAPKQSYKTQKQSDSLVDYNQTGDDLEASTAVFTGISEQELLKLEARGFRPCRIKTHYELMRLECPPGLGSCTLILYRTGKLLVQGRPDSVKAVKTFINNEGL